MAILQGDVVQREKDRYRVLRVVSTRGSDDLPPSHLAVIRLRDPKARVELWSLANTHKDLAKGDVSVVVEPVEAINAAGLSKAELKTLDRRWKLIERLNEAGAQIFASTFRGKLAQKLADEKIASKPFFYSTLRIWFQSGGGGKNVLAPGYYKCGEPAKDRIPEEGAERAGRRRIVARGKGPVLTKRHRWYIERALTHAPIGLHGRTLRHAYYWMLITYYAEYVRVVPLKEGESPELDAKGSPLPQRCKVLLADHVPSLPTFRYHYNKKFAPSARARQRMTRRAFQALFKPIPTGTVVEVDGIGSRYYTDSTVLDTYVVSRFDRTRIIGRPTLYLVVDQFSRLIVGMHLGLEPPNWVGAMLALYNCSIDKVQFCKQYDIEIAPRDWPTGAFPEHFMSDRGGDHIAVINDRLSEGFGITLDTAAPYLGSAKGVGERAFGTIQASFGPYIPGYVDPEFMGRGEPSPALKAVLNVTEVTRIIIRQILDANLRTVTGYEATPAQIADRVASQPLAIWRWCEENLRVNHIRKDLDHLKRHLWPEVTLRTSRKLLQFCTGLYFQGEHIPSQDWLFEALRTKAEFDARYHPLDLSSLTVLQPGRTGAFEAHPTRRCRRLAVYGYSELMALRRLGAINNADADEDSLPSRVAHRAANMKTVSAAKKEARQHTADNLQTDAERLRNRRGNKEEEIAANTAEALGLTGGAVDARTAAASVPSISPTDDAVRALINKRKSTTPLEDTHE